MNLAHCIQTNMEQYIYLSVLMSVNKKTIVQCLFIFCYCYVIAVSEGRDVG